MEGKKEMGKVLSWAGMGFLTGEKKGQGMFKRRNQYVSVFYLTMVHFLPISTYDAARDVQKDTTCDYGP